MSQKAVAVIMGSDSDLPTMQAAIDMLAQFGVPSQVRILSAHRTPDEMLAFARSAVDSGFGVIIAGAGGAAHLPGMVASATTLPVIGVPVVANSMKMLGGVDALLSMVQMPAGVPVATVAIGNSANAALLAIRMLSIENSELRAKMDAFQKDMHNRVTAKDASIIKTRA